LTREAEDAEHADAWTSGCPPQRYDALPVASGGHGLPNLRSRAAGGTLYAGPTSWADGA
jgi:hypothetical protein